jgi:hypothetical protein
VGHWSGRVGRCYWSCVVGRIDEETLNAFVRGIERIGESNLGDLVVLDLAHGIDRPKPLHRQRITEAVQKLPNKAHIRGHAVVANSSVARGVLTVVNWFVKPEFPEKVFRMPELALGWLKQHDSTLDPQRVLDDVRLRVPDYEKLRW